MLNFTLSSNQTIPAIGLGTWQAESDTVIQAINTAVNVGYRHIDTAAIYGNEQAVGTALQQSMKTHNLSREQLFVTSKLWNSFHEPEQVLPAVKRSLADLKLDYLDLYLIHWAVAFKASVGLGYPEQSTGFFTLNEVPLNDTWQAMEQLVSLGLVKSIGVSNFSPKQLRQILTTADIKPAVNQVENHPFLAQNNLLSFCQENDILVTAYAPLGSGHRNASIKEQDEPVVLQNELLTNIANQHNVSVAQVVLAWQLSRGVCVIPKSSNEKRIQENFAASEVQLTAQDIATINGIDLNYRYFRSEFWTRNGSPYRDQDFWQE